MSKETSPGAITDRTNSDRWRSPDGGRTWREPGWTFSGPDLLPMTFVQFGPGNAGAPGGYAYMTAIRSGDVSRSLLQPELAEDLSVRNALTMSQ